MARGESRSDFVLLDLCRNRSATTRRSRVRSARRRCDSTTTASARRRRKSLPQRFVSSLAFDAVGCLFDLLCSRWWAQAGAGEVPFERELFEQSSIDAIVGAAPRAIAHVAGSPFLLRIDEKKHDKTSPAHVQVCFEWSSGVLSMFAHILLAILWRLGDGRFLSPVASAGR